MTNLQIFFDSSSGAFIPVSKIVNSLAKSDFSLNYFDNLLSFGAFKISYLCYGILLERVFHWNRV